MLQGFVMNMQPSEAEMGFDIRLPPTVHLEQLKERIDKEWVPAYKNMSYTVKVFAIFTFQLSNVLLLLVHLYFFSCAVD